MKKGIYSKVALVVCSIALIQATIQGSPMQLINTKTGHVVIEFQGEKTIFHDPYLEKAMKYQGIHIPPFLQKDFHDKEVVRLSDPEFQKAFHDVYYKLSLNQQLYQWKE